MHTLVIIFTEDLCTHHLVSRQCLRIRHRVVGRMKLGTRCLSWYWLIWVYSFLLASCYISPGPRLSSFVAVEGYASLEVSQSL